MLRTAYAWLRMGGGSVPQMLCAELGEGVGSILAYPLAQAKRLRLEQ